MEESESRISSDGDEPKRNRSSLTSSKSNGTFFGIYFAENFCILSHQLISLLSIFLIITEIDQKEPSERMIPWHGQKAPGTYLSPRRAGSDAGIKNISESPIEEQVWQPPSAFIKGLGKHIKKFTQMVKRQQEEQEAQTPLR
jgi:hypothetical protein